MRIRALALGAAFALAGLLAVLSSTDGGARSAPHSLGARATRAGAGFPKVAAGPRPGDFRAAWEDDGRGTSYVIWSEGTSYAGPGGTWWARGG
jgi:hypothetical protein